MKQYEINLHAFDAHFNKLNLVNIYV
jgi:hypothetical protein